MDRSIISRHHIQSWTHGLLYLTHDLCLIGFLYALKKGYISSQFAAGLILSGFGLTRYTRKPEFILFISYGISFLVHFLKPIRSLHLLAAIITLFNTHELFQAPPTTRNESFKACLWYLPLLHGLSLRSPLAAKYNLIAVSLIGTLFSIMEDTYWLNLSDKIPRRLKFFVYQWPLAFVLMNTPLGQINTGFEFNCKISIN